MQISGFFLSHTLLNGPVDYYLSGLLSTMKAISVYLGFKIKERQSVLPQISRENMVLRNTKRWGSTVTLWRNMVTKNRIRKEPTTCIKQIRRQSPAVYTQSPWPLGFNIQSSSLVRHFHSLVIRGQHKCLWRNPNKGKHCFGGLFGTQKPSGYLLPLAYFSSQEIQLSFTNVR